MKTTGMLRHVLTMQEAAGLLRCSVDKAYRLARTGNLPGAFKLGGVWRVRVETLEKWLKER